MNWLHKILGKFRAASVRTPSLSQGILDCSQGFVDIDLPIISIDETGQTTRVTAKGLVEGKVIGFAIDLHAGWNYQPVDGAVGFYWGRGGYRSIGPESDEFVRLLGRLYSQPMTSDLRMLPEIAADVVGLDTDPSNLMSKPVGMKFFLWPDDETRYAEVYTNVDVRGGWLQFHEKDAEYRPTLLRALTAA